MATITHSKAVGAYLVEVAGMLIRRPTRESALDCARLLGAKMVLHVEVE